MGDIYLTNVSIIDEIKAGRQFELEVTNKGSNINGTNNVIRSLYFERNCQFIVGNLL